MDADLRLDQQVCFALYSASRATTAAYRKALAGTGLTYPQYLVLLALWEQDGQTIGQLGHSLTLDSGTLSPLITRMEKSELVRREKVNGDARSVAVNLTERGLELRAEAARIQCALLDRLGLPLDDLAELKRLAHRIVEALERS